jgi:CRP-like cAMP-binding protein
MECVAQNKKINLLQAMPIFGGMREDTLDYLLGMARYVCLPAGEYFYHEGDPASSLFVLVSGKVQLLKRWQGHDFSLKPLDEGDCFGQVALIDLQPRNTSSLVVEQSCAIEISDEDLYQLYQYDKEQLTLLRMNMAREVCRRLREANNRVFAADVQTRKMTALVSPH